MKHTEANYINHGAKYQRATPEKSRAVAEKIRAMLDSEDPKDRTEARRLIEQGRTEARQD